MSAMNAIEWSGAFFGIVGAMLLALNVPYSGLGFVAFLLSNLFWVAYGFIRKLNGILAMQLVFTCTSALGIYRWLLV